MAKFFPFQKLVDEITVDSFTMFERLCFFFFSFDMQQGHMGEGEVTLLFLTFECIVIFGKDTSLLNFLPCGEGRRGNET